MSINLTSHEWANENNFPCFYYPEITSTNDVSKNEFPKTHKNFALYLSDHQTQGRGRNQNNWQNLNQGEVLLSTWCFKTTLCPQPIFTPLIGLALYKSLKKIDHQLPLRLKAPNDIYLGSGKVAGLLVEVSQQGTDFFICVGLGLNVYGAPQVDLPTTSLDEHSKVSKPLWQTFLSDLKQGFEGAIEQGANPSLSQENQDQLLLALNQGLSEEQKIQSISPQCDLHTPAGNISWMDL